MKKTILCMLFPESYPNILVNKCKPPDTLEIHINSQFKFYIHLYLYTCIISKYFVNIDCPKLWEKAAIE